ncbi:polyprenyl diphosphate synthase [Streptomyces sp. ODS28]|uniref:polyprenyl diphosphate synthase n=1 Tax=Streptomyces sp. ODS28 TaxID=3136688 RepID=UPI0031E52242
MAGSDRGGEPAELRAAYEVCEAEARQFAVELWAAAETLPVETRPSLYAIASWSAYTDRIIDEGPLEGREERLAQWSADTLADLRAGHSSHPLRWALVDTVRRWGLDEALIEEHLDSARADCAAAPVFETFGDQRRYLRGCSGALAELWVPLLEPRGPEAFRLMSVLGEACQMADLFEDLPDDLAAGRCYLPRQDLRGLGLDVDGLRRGEREEALDAFVDTQLAHWRELLEEAVLAPSTVEVGHQTFVHTLLLGAQMHYDEVTLLRSRVLTEGLESLVTGDGQMSRRAARPGPGPAPGHIAVIADGNRRWAEARGLPADQGHRAGIRAVLRLVNAAQRTGIRHVTVYMFSTENWHRSQGEVADLFDAFADWFARGAQTVHELGVKVRWSGRRDRLEESLASSFELLESMTANNDKLTLTICLDYGGREELAAAARALAAEAVAGTIRPEQVGMAEVARHLYVPEMPDVDLLVRTCEQRISNFLLWHLAYAELVFDPAPWPDFDLARLRDAVDSYAGRERRFGGDAELPAQPGNLEPARNG